MKAIEIIRHQLKILQVPYTGISDQGGNFFAISYDGTTVQKANKFHKAMSRVKCLDQCKGEHGWNEKFGHWQRYKFWTPSI